MKVAGLGQAGMRRQSQVEKMEAVRRNGRGGGRLEEGHMGVGWGWEWGVEALSLSRPGGRTSQSRRTHPPLEQAVPPHAPPPPPPPDLSLQATPRG